MDLSPSTSWLETSWEGAIHILCNLPHVVIDQWNRYTTSYPGYLERCLITIGTLYSLSVAWIVIRVVLTVGFSFIKLCLTKVDQFVGWSPEPIFEDANSTKNTLDKELYGLEHMALNWTWEDGLRSMWMNMGYWKNTSSFPQASENLLNYVLQKAEIIPSPEDKKVKKQAISILDLGFGCGDQSLYLTNRLPENVNVVSYVGITLSKVQYEFAKKRVLGKRDVVDILLDNPRKQDDEFDSKGIPFPFTSSNQEKKGNISLFNADASNPSLWPSSLHLTLLPEFSPPTSPLSQPPQFSSLNIPYTTSPPPSPRGVVDPQDTQVQIERGETGRGEKIEEHEHWTLGLDSLYHFCPSRIPILKYTHDRLNSNLIAFDLFRPSSTSTRNNPLIQFLCLRALCLVASIPYQNLLTEEEYMQMLVKEVGYKKENILIEDISEYVFPGLERFISCRTMEMKKMGMEWKRWVGFKGVAWIVKTGLLRGGVVVARKGSVEIEIGGDGSGAGGKAG